ncbi:MAG: 2-amino-4-hydroxy-6-hydroxymethyldihydropteridine diphosphokinase [Thiomicrospira sp.]|uniref:2-amino-4-hydroxy-6- hydroxymethyldihydropteridine diphosphokinase n=1 Tax=Thiomicrospira sp. TaxID=935 RepID=UPI0019F312EE|nr:2-amino-4-hydroxy-6-hydroxymethyldihydropteridine diphosphokinase [Thiomicrospira sp.]MBE0494129.1 2-amino-4-hydroxy-6-hydroxymethyldihydropteridine diphosphokinase [Thiomicrospira sp.]
MNKPWFRVAIGLGSNLDNPAEQIKTAVQNLQALDSIRHVVLSDLWLSKPQGPQDQPDFVNAVCVCETCLTPAALLAALQTIEQDQGRIKQRHWGERLIDLDILLYANQLIEQPGLVVPHPCMTQRDFVLIPLAQVWPEDDLPNLGKLTELIANLDQSFILNQSSAETQLDTK